MNIYISRDMSTKQKILWRKRDEWKPLKLETILDSSENLPKRYFSTDNYSKIEPRSHTPSHSSLLKEDYRQTSGAI